MFSVGQKVVCIFDFSEFAAQPWADQLCIEMPVKGAIYTVRRVVQRIQCGDGVYGIMVAEILNMPNALDKGGEGGNIRYDSGRLMAEPDEIAFDSAAFRPIVTAENEAEVAEAKALTQAAKETAE